MTTTFADLGVRPRTLDTLVKLGMTVPKTVQLEAIPPLLEHRDAVIQAPTGSGKTLAFLIIGCPGRLLDLAGQGVARLHGVEYFVLDKADDMLDQGFAKDIERIIGMLPSHDARLARQTVLASATMPGWVQQTIDKYLVEPAHIAAIHSEIPDLEHGILALPRTAKLDALHTLLTRQAQHNLPQTLVFHRTKHGAKKLARDLIGKGHRTGELQGNLSQNARDRAIADFRRGNTKVLVATNVAARGIDVEEIGLVINFELPETAQWLTHRVGRTARNGNAGHAITMLTPEDSDQWNKLRRSGAPALRHIDSTALLRDAVWSYTNAPPEPVSTARPASAPRTASTRRWSGPRRRPTSR